MYLWEAAEHRAVVHELCAEMRGHVGCAAGMKSACAGTAGTANEQDPSSSTAHRPFCPCSPPPLAASHGALHDGALGMMRFRSPWVLV